MMPIELGTMRCKLPCKSAVCCLYQLGVLV